jgi:hypothetical protein
MIHCPSRPLLVVAALALLTCCPHPTPTPVTPGSGDAATPNNWVAGARATANEIAWVAPTVDAAINADAQVPVDMKAAVHRAATRLVDDALPGFVRGLDAFEARSVQHCPQALAECEHVYDAVVIVREALLGLAQAVVNAGFTPAGDIGRIVDGVCAVIDQILGFVRPDAGFARVGETTDATLDGMVGAATTAGHHLGLLPPLSPPATSR